MITTQHVHATAVLPAARMDDAVRFYRTLGFEVTAYDAGYAWVSHLGHEIAHLRTVPALDPTENPCAWYLRVEDVNQFRASLPNGMNAGPIVDEPWGMREFALADPSGNQIRIGQPI